MPIRAVHAKQGPGYLGLIHDNGQRKAQTGLAFIKCLLLASRPFLLCPVSKRADKWAHKN